MFHTGGRIWYSLSVLVRIDIFQNRRVGGRKELKKTPICTDASGKVDGRGGVDRCGVYYHDLTAPRITGLECPAWNIPVRVK